MPPYENGFKVVSDLNNSFDIGPDFVEPELEVDFNDLVDVEKYSQSRSQQPGSGLRSHLQQKFSGNDMLNMSSKDDSRSAKNARSESKDASPIY